MLERMIGLGELARKIKLALGNNGHRPEKLGEIRENLKHQAHKSSSHDLG